MIFADQVRNVAEDFITDTLAKWPKVTEVLLSHPSWVTWCEKVAAKLSQMEAEAILEGKPFNALKEIQIWAAGYADHALTRAETKYFEDAKKTLPESL